MLEAELVQKIQVAFNSVLLEDGIGLWEAQGLDDYANDDKMKSLKAKDERMNWENLSYQDLAQCESSLSFFDAKGLTFCLAKFLIFDILETQILQEQNISSPEVVFTLTDDTYSEFQQNRFSLLSVEQIECVIEFLKYKLKNAVPDDEDYFYKQLQDGLSYWSDKLGN